MNNRRVFSLILCVALCVVVLAALLALVGDPASAQTTTRYVATTGIDTGGCTDPNDPCGTVQYAVDQAVSDDVIKVATGSYTNTNDAQVVYVYKTVTIRGGYTAPDFTDPPDPEANPTTLDALGQGRVFFVKGKINPTIEGLRIEGGRLWESMPGDVTGLGAGVYISTAQTTISDCIVANNRATYGGGLAVLQGDVTFIGNTVQDNVASNLPFDGMYNVGNGGGLYLESSSATFIGNIVQGNWAESRGGGLQLVGSDATLTNNIVRDNFARGYRGFFAGEGYGLHVRSSHVTLRNTIISDNWGGLGLGDPYGALDIGSSSARVLHTTIARNDPIGVRVSGNSTVALTNTILVSHPLGISAAAGNTMTLESTLWGSEDWANDTDWAGGGTIVTGTVNVWGDPAFVDPDAGDFHIGPGSAAINAGVDAGVVDDIDGEQRPDWCFFDIGADELATGKPCQRLYFPLILRNAP